MPTQSYYVLPFRMRNLLFTSGFSSGEEFKMKFKLMMKSITVFINVFQNVFSRVCVLLETLLIFYISPFALLLTNLIKTGDLSKRALNFNNSEIVISKYLN